ncbi:DUF2158 domain-containing protein [Acinetobacter sp. ANC 4558]|uniref:YodC family protein n=1 Tax=Acinetobacter sp. ANC 4558 TaxID=1977876 RepID=UPI000A33F038|nr:DUF2158 domain-containing protein [Acinetobacter sp. ANC 4558]OTG86410.1 DUF2158 domain-containing protein [Acinetobacter sp. ANC 4558]
MSEVRKPKYQIGDVVKLNAGGPEMSVYKTMRPINKPSDFTGIYECQWFAGRKLESGKFAEASLTLSQQNRNEIESKCIV